MARGYSVLRRRLCRGIALLRRKKAGSLILSRRVPHSAVAATLRSLAFAPLSRAILSILSIPSIGPARTKPPSFAALISRLSAASARLRPALGRRAARNQARPKFAPPEVVFQAAF